VEVNEALLFGIGFLNDEQITQWADELIEDTDFYEDEDKEIVIEYLTEAYNRWNNPVHKIQANRIETDVFFDDGLSG